MLRPGQSTSPPPPPPPASSSSSAPAPLELPSTDHDDVSAAERAYEASRAATAAAGAGASAAASADADDKAFQLVWALVHSSWQSDARRGRELAAALQAKAAAAAAAAGGSGGGGGERARELAYLEAVRKCGVFFFSFFRFSLSHFLSFSLGPHSRSLSLSPALIHTNKPKKTKQKQKKVGAFKNGDSVAARKLLAGILSATPHSRQAGALKAAVDDQIVRDGLLGIGIGAAAVAAVGCVLAMAFGSRR